MMYFKNAVGTVYVIENKVISENEHAKVTVEVKDERKLTKFFEMEVEYLKLISLEFYGHF